MLTPYEYEFRKMRSTDALVMTVSYLIQYHTTKIPKSPTSRMVFNSLEDSRSHNRRMGNLVADLYLNLQGSSCWYFPVPLWTSQFQLDLVGIGKEERFKAVIREIFLHYTSRYQGSDAVYADGSKSENCPGFAVISRRKKSFLGSLDLHCSCMSSLLQSK